MKRPTLQAVVVAVLAAAGILLNCLAYLLAFILAVAGVEPASAGARPMPYSPAQPETDASEHQSTSGGSWCRPAIFVDRAQYLKRLQAIYVDVNRLQAICDDANLTNDQSRPPISVYDETEAEALFDARWNNVNDEALTAAQRNPTMGRRV